MRFSFSQTKDAFERSTLKLAVFCLSVLTLTFSILLAVDFTKEPIVVERSCETSLAKVSAGTQSKDEVMNFVRLALRERFDSTVEYDPAVYLSQELLVVRNREQDELKRSGIDQRMIVREVFVDGDHFTADVDRIVAVGKVRSAIPMKLSLQVLSKVRSLTNPYGLIISSLSEIKEDAKHE